MLRSMLREEGTQSMEHTQVKLRWITSLLDQLLHCWIKSEVKQTQREIKGVGNRCAVYRGSLYTPAYTHWQRLSSTAKSWACLLFFLSSTHTQGFTAAFQSWAGSKHRAYSCASSLFQKLHLVETKLQCLVKLEYPLGVASFTKTEVACQETQKTKTKQAHSKITLSATKAAAHAVLGISWICWAAVIVKKSSHCPSSHMTVITLCPSLQPSPPKKQYTFQHAERQGQGKKPAR